MKEWKSIVVGIDFSDSSIAALREAARMAHWHHCALHFATVIVREEDHDAPPLSPTATAIARAQTEEKLKLFCLQHTEFLGEAHYHVLVGHPFHKVCQLARDLSADLLILGSCDHEHQGHRVGTTASECVRKAPFPVLLIHYTHDNPFHKILSAVDFSPTSIKATRLAAEIAFENQSELHIVHIREPDPPALDDSPNGPPDGQKDEESSGELEPLKTQLESLRDTVQADYPDLIIRTHLVKDDQVPQSLSDFIKSHEISLAMLGTHGRSGYRPLVKETTAERILDDCPCSILVVKPDHFCCLI